MFFVPARFSPSGRTLSLAAAVFIALALAVLSACSDDVTSPSEETGEWIRVHFEGESTQVYLNDLLSIDVDGEDAVRLNELVDTSIVHMYVDKDDGLHEARFLYAYRIVGDDGFSASMKGYPDNTWDQMPLGYILKTTRRVIFPDDAIDLAGAYNVKETRYIRVLRKFDVISPDTSAFYELADMPVVQVENYEAILEDAVRLSDFVSALIADPVSHSYYITALDGYGTIDPMTWEELQTGYWLLETEKTIFTDPDLNTGPYKLKVLRQIEVE